MDEHALVVDVRQNDTLSPVELQGIDEVCRLSFKGDGGEAYTWASGNWHVVGRVDGKIIASIEIIDRQAKVGDRTVRLGGIGGVATHPDYRRRGYASALMNRAAEFMRYDLKVDFGMLFCAESKIHLYGSVGWQVIKAPVMIDQPGGKIVFDAVTMILPCQQSTWPEGSVDICGLPW